MKRIILPLFLLLSFVLAAYADVPNEIRYNGRLKSYQTPVTGTKQIKFQIYASATGGTALWDSGYLSVSITSGIFSCVLTPNVDWRKKDLWLQLIVDGKELTPREKLMAQPYALQARAAENGVPAGTVIAYAGNNVPAGYMLCDGSTVNTSDYPELFQAIGTTYGGTVTQFKLPDFRGMFLRGQGSNTVTTTPGGTVTIASAGLGVKQSDAMRDISGSFPNTITASWAITNYPTSGVFSYSDFFNAGNGGGNGAANNAAQVTFNPGSKVPTSPAENRPANYAVNYCIKY